MQPNITPSKATWLAAASIAASEAGAGLVGVLAGSKLPKDIKARWAAFKIVLDANPAYSKIGLARTSGFHHSSIIYALRRLDGRSPRKIQAMRAFSKMVLLDFVRSHLDMSVEELAAAVSVSPSLIRERARAAGIVLKPSYPRIGQNVDLRPVVGEVVDLGFVNPWGRHDT